MSRVVRPAMAGIGFLLICGVLGTANPAFADKSAAVSPADKSASVSVDDKVALTPDDKVA
jgi:hypothetical protein